MPWRFIRKLKNSNICRAVTDGPFAVQICQGCTVDFKKKNPYLVTHLRSCWDNARLQKTFHNSVVVPSKGANNFVAIELDRWTIG